MSHFNFGAASLDEPYVYGAQRPGYDSSSPISDVEVGKWIDFMQQQGIKRVCCLLKDKLSYYQSDLLVAYRHSFGKEALCWAPIGDFTLADDKLLTETILPFLADSVYRKEPVVVHCSAGIGRTGHVLAAWLVYGRCMTNEEALNTVAVKRNPYEAEGKTKLNVLLDQCRVAATKNFGKKEPCLNKAQSYDSTQERKRL